MAEMKTGAGYLRYGLSEEQSQVINSILNLDSSKFQEIVMPPGSGKTTLLISALWDALKQWGDSETKVSAAEAFKNSLGYINSNFS